jgi:hypothetical protein
MLSCGSDSTDNVLRLDKELQHWTCFFSRPDFFALNFLCVLLANGPRLGHADPSDAFLIGFAVDFIAKEFLDLIAGCVVIKNDICLLTGVTYDRKINVVSIFVNSTNYWIWGSDPVNCGACFFVGSRVLAKDFVWVNWFGHTLVLNQDFI